MTNKIEIKKELVRNIIINREKNMEINEHYAYLLKDENNKKLTKEYECMINLGNDHFAVCNLVADIEYSINDANASESRYYNIIKNEYKINNCKLKWGIIRINRNKEGDVIPFGESMVVPLIYDRISGNNLKTATVYIDNKMTYLELDINSENYTHQLVPCILEQAVPFSTEYENFAECTLNGKNGYLPRNVKIKEQLNSKDLLDKKQVILISKFLENKDIDLNAETQLAYFYLTGLMLEKNNIRTLKKTINI